MTEFHYVGGSMLCKNKSREIIKIILISFNIWSQFLIFQFSELNNLIFPIEVRIWSVNGIT